MSRPEPQRAAPVEHTTGAAPEPSLYHLILFQTGSDQINREMVHEVQAGLDQIITTDHAHTDIDIWIESPGGDAHAAYKLILDLRHRSKRLRAVIPDYAKSAATLLALGVDTIFMNAAAELGPLDVQIEHPDPDREGTIVSALDVADSLEFLGTTAVTLVLTAGATIIDCTGLRRSEILREMLQFTSQFLKPVTEKLDPHLLHQAANQLRIAERYAINMMDKRNLPAISPSGAKDLMRRLIRAYPAHGFVISRDEARELGLPVEDMESYPRHQEVKRLYANFIRGTESIVRVVGDSVMDGPAGQQEADSNETEPHRPEANAE
jgi:Serine dehydrogenase proteinase